MEYRMPVFQLKKISAEDGRDIYDMLRKRKFNLRIRFYLHLLLDIRNKSVLFEDLGSEGMNRVLIFLENK